VTGTHYSVARCPVSIRWIGAHYRTTCLSNQDNRELRRRKDVNNQCSRKPICKGNCEQCGAPDLEPYVDLADMHPLGGEHDDPNDLFQLEPVYDNDGATFPVFLEYDFQRHDYNEPDESDGGWQRACRAEDY